MTNKLKAMLRLPKTQESSQGIVKLLGSSSMKNVAEYRNVEDQVNLKAIILVSETFSTHKMLSRVIKDHFKTYPSLRIGISGV